MPELEAPEVPDVLPGGEAESIVEAPSSAEVDVHEDPTGESAEAEGAEASPKPDAQEDVQDGRVLSPDLRSHLKALKAQNPQLEKKIRGAFFALDSLKKEFPGGTKEAIQLGQQLKEFGGLDAIRNAQANTQFYLDVDAKIEKGDPAVVDALGEMLPVEAYPNIASRFMQTFAAKDADGFNRMLSGYIFNTFAQAGVEHYLARAEDAIKWGKPEEAVPILKEVSKWMQGFGEIANKKPEPKPIDQEQEKLNSRAKELDQRETEQFTQSVGQEIGSWSKSRVLAEAQPFLKGRKLNQDQMDMLEMRSLNKVRASLKADQQFSEAYVRYFSAKDREGLLKLVKSATDKLLPAAVKESYRALFSDFSGTKPAAAPAKPGEKPGQASAPQGWTKISGPPSGDQVDNAKTPFSWKMRSGAILKDGRKVFWGQQPPAA